MRQWSPMSTASTGWGCLRVPQITVRTSMRRRSGCHSRARPASIIITVSATSGIPSCPRRISSRSGGPGSQEIRSASQRRWVALLFSGSHMLFTDAEPASLGLIANHNSVVLDRQTPEAADGSPQFAEVWELMCYPDGMPYYRDLQIRRSGRRLSPR